LNLTPRHLKNVYGAGWHGNNPEENERGLKAGEERLLIILTQEKKSALSWKDRTTSSSLLDGKNDEEWE